MRKLLVVLLGLGAVACQPEPKAKTRQPVPEVAVVTPAARPAPPGPSADMLTAPMLALLEQFNLAPLWADTTREDGPPTMYGFIGDDHYSISIVFDEVRQDSQKPQLFQVRGRSRYRKQIVPFKGTLRVQAIADCDSCPHIPLPPEYGQKAYTAKARLELAQDKQGKETGVFAGEALLDFVTDSQGKGELAHSIMTGYQDKKSPTYGSGRLLRGYWTNYLTQQRKPFLVANDVFVIAPEIYSDFGVGDRGTLVNPRYAKLGWSEMWENEEWWADSPKPSLNL